MCILYALYQSVSSMHSNSVHHVIKIVLNIHKSGNEDFQTIEKVDYYTADWTTLKHKGFG